MVNISVVIALLDDDGFVAIPMIAVADDVTITVPVTISVTLTDRYANTANTNPHLFLDAGIVPGFARSRVETLGRSAGCCEYALCSALL
jgi:hypothetical protein